MILNEGNFHKLREKKKLDKYDTYLLSESSSNDSLNSESIKKYKKKLYKIPNPSQTSDIFDIIKELSLEYFFKIALLFSCICIFLFVYLFWFDTPTINEKFDSERVNRCSGTTCQEQTCAKAKRHEVTGNLCMDLCYTNTMQVPKCSNYLSYFSNSTYQYFTLSDPESTLICLPTTNFENYQKIKEGIDMDQFRALIYNKILANLNEPNTAERIVNKIFMFTDVNHDFKLSYAEAETLWMMLNQKHSYFILSMMDKSYIPQILDFCGPIIQVEEIKNYLYETNNYSLLKSVFLNNNNWLKIHPNHKLKISLGILEFFLDSVSHNPNDDFGPQSLYLCSSIESSFGYTFFNEAKLVNYDFILNGHELESKLSNRECSSDLDCQYTKECTAKCDLNTRKCTSSLNELQIKVFCKFLKDFLQSDPELKAGFMSLIDKCLKLKSFYLNEKTLYSQNQVPIDLSQQEIFLKKRAYWNASMEYTLLTKELHDKIWETIKLVNDPIKPKKTTRKPPTNEKSHPKNLDKKN